MTKSSAEQVSGFLLDFLPSLLPKPLDKATASAIDNLRGDVDTWVGEPRLRRELLEAAQKAESNFRSEAREKLKNDELVQAVASFPVFDNDLFQKTLLGLPDHLNEDFLGQDLQNIIADDWKGKFSPLELREGAAIYLNCLRIQLLKVDGYTDIVVRLATLRIDVRTEMIESQIEQVLIAINELRNLIKFLKIETSDIESRKKLLLDPFVVHENDISRIRAIFESPKNIDKAREILKTRRILWITGLSGIGKRTSALALAIELSVERIYFIPRSISWQQVDESQVANSAILFPDALGALRFERENADDDVIFLRRIMDRGNAIILTSPDDVLSDALRETRIAKFVVVSQYELDRNAYSTKDKETIFQKMLVYAYENQHLINENQYKLAKKLAPSRVKDTDNKKSTKHQVVYATTQFQKLLKDHWLPIDIERFVFVSLPTIHSLEEIDEVLRMDADIDKRIHSWFLNLTAPAQSFVLTLTIFAGFSSDEIWKRYEAITKNLRELDPLISVIPLGLLRQITNPFITQVGSIDFVNPRIYHAVVNEIAKNYREYFLAVLPLLTKWSIPTKDVSDEEIGISIDSNKDIFTAIAYMVGEVGKYGIDDVSTIIETWASNKYGRVAKNAGMALQVIASETNQTQQVLSFIKEMSRDYESDNAQQRRWTAASALWRIGKLKVEYDYSDFVLRNLDHLAKDPSDYVVSSVAYAVNALSSIFGYEQLSPLIIRLSKSKDYRTKKSICSALDGFVAKNGEDVLDLLEAWVDSESTNAFKTCVYYLFLGQNLSKQDRRNITIKALEKRPRFFSQAFGELLLTPEEIYPTISTLKNMFKENPDEFYQQFVASLAQSEVEEPSINLLSTLRQVVRSESDRTFAQIVEAIENKYRLRKYVEFVNQFTNLINNDSEEIIEYLKQGVGDEHMHDFIAEIIEKTSISEEYFIKLKNIWINFAVSNPVEYQKLQTEILATRKPEKEYPKTNNLFAEIDFELQIAIQNRIGTMLASKTIHIYDYLLNACEDVVLFNRVLTACEALIARLQLEEALREILISLSRQDFYAYNKLHKSFYDEANPNFVSNHQEVHSIFLSVDQDLVRYFEKHIIANNEGYLAIFQLENPLMRSYIINAVRNLSKDVGTCYHLISILANRALSSFPSTNQDLWLLIERNDGETSEFLLPLYQLKFNEVLIEKKYHGLLSSGESAFNIIIKSNDDINTTILALEKLSDADAIGLSKSLAGNLIRIPGNRLSFETFASKQTATVFQKLLSSVRSELFNYVKTEYDVLEDTLSKSKEDFLRNFHYRLYTSYDETMRQEYVYLFELFIKQHPYSDRVKQLLLDEAEKNRSLDEGIMRLSNENRLFAEFLLGAYKDLIMKSDSQQGLPYYPLLELDSTLFAEIFVTLAVFGGEEDKRIVRKVLISLANWQILQNSSNLFQKLRYGLGNIEKRKNYEMGKDSLEQFREMLKNIAFQHPEIGMISLYSMVFEKENSSSRY